VRSACAMGNLLRVLYNRDADSRDIFVDFESKYEKLQMSYTHNRFTALLEFVRDHPGEQVPER